MDWIRTNYDRFAVLLGALILFLCAFFIWRNASELPDYLAALQSAPPPREVRPLPNAVALQNLMVVAQLETALTMAGEQARVIVDAGSAQGVQPGNVFTMIRQADPLLSDVGVDPSANQDPTLPVEEVGRCIAVDVRETLTTCLLLRSYREVVVGDRVELRAGGPQTARMTK